MFKFFYANFSICIWLLMLIYACRCDLLFSVNYTVLSQTSYGFYNTVGIDKVY